MKLTLLVNQTTECVVESKSMGNRGLSRNTPRRLLLSSIFATMAYFVPFAEATQHEMVLVEQLQPFGGDAYVVMLRRQVLIYRVPLRHNDVKEVTGLKAVLLRARAVPLESPATLEVVDVVDVLPWLDAIGGGWLPNMFVFQAKAKLVNVNEFWRKAVAAASCSENRRNEWMTRGRYLLECERQIRVYDGNDNEFSTYDLDKAFVASRVRWPLPSGPKDERLDVWSSINVWTSGRSSNLYITKSKSSEQTPPPRSIPPFDAWPDMRRGDILKLAKRDDGAQTVRRIRLDLVDREFVHAIAEHDGLWVVSAKDGKSGGMLRVFHVDSGRQYEVRAPESPNSSFMPEREGFIWFSEPKSSVGSREGAGPMLAMHYLNFKTGARYQYNFEVDPSFNYSPGKVLVSTNPVKAGVNF